MRKNLFLSIICMTAMNSLALAQEAVKIETGQLPLSDRTAGLEAPTAPLQLAYADTASYSTIERDALAARLKFTANPDLFSEAVQTESTEGDAIALWRNRIFKSFSTNLGQRQQDVMSEDRLMSNTDLEQQANDRRTATKIIFKETAGFLRERVPEINRLINAFKFSIENRPASEDQEANGGSDASGNRAQAGRPSNGDQKLYLKTGLRLPVEGGKLSFISESEARYGKVSSFIKINLDGQFDRSAGMNYHLGKDTLLQAERRDTHTTDPLTGLKSSSKSSISLLQIVYKF